MGSNPRPSIHPRVRMRALAACTLVLALAAAWAAQPARTATGAVDVTLRVVGATTMDTAGCTTDPQSTTLGTVQPGVAARTGADCSILFGSSNSTAALRIRQHDGTGTAMTKGSFLTRHLSGMTSISVVRDGVWIAAGQGTGGNAIRSTDGGSTWSVLDVTAPSAVEDAEVDPTGRVWLVGSGGQMRRSDDEGVTWNAVASGTTNAIEAIAWANATRGWFVANGGVVRVTTDGGATWTPQVSGTSEDFRDIAIVSPTHAFISGRNGTLLETTDGGATWNPLAVGTATDIYDIETRNGVDMVAIGRSGVIKWSDDGGVTWNDAADPFGAGVDLRDVEYLDDDTLMAIGTNGGYVAISNDGGQSWVQSGASIQGWELEPTGDGNVLVAGGAGYVMTVDDTGTVGRAYTLPDELRGAAMPSRDVAWAAGGWGAVFRTDDGGATWTPTPTGMAHTIYDLEAPTEDIAVAVTTSGEIYRTDDAGQSWAKQTSGTAWTLDDVTMLDDQRGWVVGNGGVVRRTVDGTTWTNEDPGGVRLYGVDAASASTVYAVGDSGTIRKSTTGGAPFVSLGNSGTAESLRDVSAVSDSVVWVVGNNGTVLRTTNGGTSWSTIVAPGATNLRGVEALSDQVAVIAGYSGYARITTDGGTTWTDINPGGPYTSTNIESLAMFDQDHVLAGYGGAAALTDFAPIPDYGGGNLLSSGTGAFGACLQSVTLATQDWAVDGNGDCTAVDADPWNAIPLGLGHAGALVAHTTSIGEQGGQAVLRFGVRAPDAATPGRYAAGITFEVVAAS